MANRQAFGRRAAIQPQPPLVRVKSAPAELPAGRKHGDPGCEQDAPPTAPRHAPSVDAELEEWKSARRRNFALPWRPLSFMASICFGLASFVLPDSVNDAVQWPLYALAAASFYIGMKARREKRRTRKAERTQAAA